jgi:IS5 family transposase
VDIDYGLIRDIETTTASLHDSQVDLSVEGEVILRDKGYFGVPAKGLDFTMKRAPAEHPLGGIDKLRNSLISKLRSPGERPYAVSLTALSESFDKVETLLNEYSKRLM